MPASRQQTPSASRLSDHHPKLLRHVAGQPSFKSTQRNGNTSRHSSSTTSSASTTRSAEEIEAAVRSAIEAANRQTQPSQPQNDLSTMVQTLLHNQNLQQQQLNWLVTEVASLKTSTQAVHSGVQRLDTALTYANTSLSITDSTLNEVKAVVDEMRGDIQDISRSTDNLDAIETTVNTIEYTVDKLGGNVNNIEEKVDNLGSIEETVDNIQDAVDNMGHIGVTTNETNQICALEATSDAILKVVRRIDERPELNTSTKLLDRLGGFEGVPFSSTTNYIVLAVARIILDEIDSIKERL